MKDDAAAAEGDEIQVDCEDRSKLKLSSTRGEPVACSIAVFDQVGPSLTTSKLLQCHLSFFRFAISHPNTFNIFAVIFRQRFGKTE